MSSLNGFNGQQVRPAARPSSDQPQTNHPNAAQQPQAWQPQGAHYQQPPQQWPQQQAQPQYPQQNYGQGYQAPAPQAGYGGLSQNPDAYAPSFEPYSPVSNQRAQQPAQQQNGAGYAPQNGYAQSHYGQGYNGQPQNAHQWPGNSLDHNAAAARGFEPGGYAQQPSTGGHAAYRTADQQHHAEPAFADWPQQQNGYDYGDANGHHHGHDQQHDEMGFAQPAGGELDQGYTEEDGEEYEVEETGRGRRPLMIAAALAGAIFVGGGMAYSYKAFFGGNGAGNPPMVKSASEPSKIKPLDAGGKQFAHADSKIMGRLGDGAGSDGAAAASTELDANGTRKVSTLVVGRDGSIQAPAASPADNGANADPSGNVAVPGMMVVDALGGNKHAAAPSAAAPAAAPPSPAPQKLVVTPPAAPAPPQKPVTIAKADTASADPDVTDSTGSIAPTASAPAPVTPKPVVKKVAAAKPEVVNDAYTGSSTGAAAAAAPVTAAPTGANGYVAVLASVPRSDSSRMTALKRFADMQQKYGTVLNGKTPDVAEADLGAKGAYHRLVVGPPASRQQAATLCTELKAQGYNDCWVTAY